MLDWFSSPESVATVDSYGRVTIKGEAGTEATITATLKTDAAQRSSYRIAVTGGSDPVTDYKTGIPAKFTFKPGQTVDMKFDSTPANAVYSGTVLEGLTLSSDGRMTGTAPDKEGTYSLGTITVTWPGHSETFNAEGTITVKKSNNSGGGGGCNGGFGIFALALGAFWALKRK